MERLREHAAELVSRKVSVIVATGGNNPALVAKAADLDHPDPVHQRRRSGPGRAGREPRPAGGQRHRRELVRRGNAAETDRAAAGDAPACGRDRSAGQSQQSGSGGCRGGQRGRRRRRSACGWWCSRRARQMKSVPRSTRWRGNGWTPRSSAAIRSIPPAPSEFIALGTRHRIPLAYANREFVEAGGLISYGNNVADAYRRVGILHRPGAQGRQARRSAGRSRGQVRADRQPEGRQGARPHPCRIRCSAAPTR